MNFPKKRTGLKLSSSFIIIYNRKLLAYALDQNFILLWIGFENFSNNPLLLAFVTNKEGTIIYTENSGMTCRLVYKPTLK